MLLQDMLANIQKLLVVWIRLSDTECSKSLKVLQHHNDDQQFTIKWQGTLQNLFGKAIWSIYAWHCISSEAQTVDKALPGVTNYNVMNRAEKRSWGKGFEF